MKNAINIIKKSKGQTEVLETISVTSEADAMTKGTAAIVKHDPKMTANVSWDWAKAPQAAPVSYPKAYTLPGKYTF